MESQLNGQKLSLVQTSKELHIHSKDFSATVKNEKCSAYSFKSLKEEIEKRSAESFSFSGKDSLKVKVFGKSKSIAPGSSLAQYLKNFTQHMITFKSQVKLACQKN